MPEVIREQGRLFPSHAFQWPFTAAGRAAPATPEKSPENFIILFNYTDVGTSSPMPVPKVPQDRAWWTTPNASFETVQLNLGQALGGVAALWTDQTDSAKKPATPEVQEGRIEDFLEEVYSLAKLNDVESATDRVFDHIDRLLLDGEFVVCDEILKRVDVEKLPTTLMRSFLTITNAAKDKLPSRKSLYLEIDRKMVQLKGDNRTRRIIGRLA